MIVIQPKRASLLFLIRACGMKKQSKRGNVMTENETKEKNGERGERERGEKEAKEKKRKIN